jgi:hypothetical protein
MKEEKFIVGFELGPDGSLYVVQIFAGKCVFFKATSSFEEFSECACLLVQAILPVSNTQMVHKLLML